MRLFRPDAYYVSVLDIPLAELKERGVEAVLLDLDNTLLPRTVERVPDNIEAWVQSVKDAGFSVCLLSNNWHERVVNAARQIEVTLVGKAVKPLPQGFFRALRELGVSRDAAVMVGDQTFTDVLGAHLVGMKAVLVTPLATQDLWHTRLLRHLDRLWLRGMEPVGGPPVFEADENDRALL